MHDDDPVLPDDGDALQDRIHQALADFNYKIMHDLIVELCADWNLPQGQAQYYVGQQLMTWAITYSVRGLCMGHAMDHLHSVQKISEIQSEWNRICCELEIALASRELPVMKRGDHLKVALELLAGIRTLSQNVRGPDDYDQANRDQIYKGLAKYGQMIHELFDAMETIT